MIIPGPDASAGSLAGKKNNLIPFCYVKQIGDDIILVEIPKLRMQKKAVLVS